MVQEFIIRVSPEAASDLRRLRDVVASKASCRPDEISDLRILRRSIDARQRNIMMNLKLVAAIGDEHLPEPEKGKFKFENVRDAGCQVVIVGAGPAGLFAALRALELGIRPVVIERGNDVDNRRADVAEISRNGILNPESNYCFGEGGAGAFSDGKLFTRSKKRGDVKEILQMLHYFGAKENILIDAHPHVGSDVLPKVIKNIRNKIIDMGGEIHFATKMSDLIMEEDSVKGIITSDGRCFEGPVILATGHSARDVYELLYDKGVKIEAKGIAVGARVEHPQELIDKIQYHLSSSRPSVLPPAEYSMVTQVDGRGVFSFCMCPGGVVVPSMSATDELLVNGMSSSARNSYWANAAFVVEIHPDDLFGHDDPLCMLNFQHNLEIEFYKAAGCTYKAPAQRLKDFVENKKSPLIPPSSYAPGLISCNLNDLLPPLISSRLRKAMKIFDRQAHGFVTNKAVMIGLESRTSSPVRILRDNETLEHPEVKGLYPAGEGAGFAGGIVSAAIDGRRCIDALSVKLQKTSKWQSFLI